MPSNEIKLKVISHDEKAQSYVVSSPMGNTVVVADTYAEMFPLMEMSPANPLFFYLQEYS